MKQDKFLMTGISQYKKNSFFNAEKNFLRALELNPNELSIYTYLVPTLLNQQKLDKALYHANIFYIRSNKSEVSCIYLGIIYFKKEIFFESIKYFDYALNLNPDNYSALVNKGICLNKLNKNEDAKIYLAEAIKLNSLDALPHISLAEIFEEESETNKAIESLRKAISLKPNDHRSIHTLSLLQLTIKDYQKGWENFEKRWAQPELSYRYKDIPKIQSLENLQGKKLLIWHDQGMGDTINFSRYVRELIKIGANVTFEVQEPLVSMFQNQFECHITGKASSKTFDFQSPLMSLPYLFKMNADNIPSTKPYFMCNEAKYRFWKNHLNLSINKINIGIAISGNKAHLKENRRKIELNYFLKLTEVSKIYLIQKNITTEQKNLIEKNKDIIFLGDDDKWIDFSDTSAIVKSMDLIITIDTSLVHLSGAMNKKTLLLLSKVSDWRWPSQNEDHPHWYESVHIFRQKIKDQWKDVIEKILPTVNQSFKEKYEKK